MTYRSPSFELDEECREVRLYGREIALQPRVFDVLAYLVRHRDRVVPKDELLEAVWPDAFVTDASLQRAVSLIRSSLHECEAPETIRTYARKGYRFVPGAERPATANVRAKPLPVADTAEGPVSESLQEARESFERGDWPAAAAHFDDADGARPLTGPDLEQYAKALQWSGQVNEAVIPFERAIAAYSLRADRVGAARAALFLAELQFERREMAVAQGWLNHAQAQLAGVDECSAHAMHDWLSARFAVVTGELDEGLRLARQARERGHRLGDTDIENLGRLYEGLALTAKGSIRDGSALLDETGAAVLSGDVSPWAGGIIYCALIWGCLNYADWARAAEWTQHFDRWCGASGVSTFPGLCRLHQAEVFSLRGETRAAEDAIDEACDLLIASAPWAAGDAWRVRGDILLNKGDLDGAEEAFRKAYALGWDAQPGLAMLQVERGLPVPALRGLERALVETDWPKPQRRGLLLAHMVLVALKADDIDRAKRALQEIDENAELVATPALTAMVDRARAELAWAEGDHTAAIAALHRALQGWQEVRSPLYASAVRLRLTEMLLELGDPDSAELELSAAEGVIEGLALPALEERCRRLRSALEASDRKRGPGE